MEEIPQWQESSCWIGHPNYYQEHQPPRLEDDDCLRYHLELHMCVWLYHLELHMCVWLYHLARTTYVCVAISSRTTFDNRCRYHVELHMMIVVDII